MRHPDFYALLGLSPAATADEIKAAFRRLALKHHPDRNPGNRESIEIFSAIHKAYETLSNPARKKEYDTERKKDKSILFPGKTLRTVVDRSKIRLTVDRRVLQPDEPVHVIVSVYENNSKVTLSGLKRFETVRGPVINTLIPPGPDSPRMEIAYTLQPKEPGYIEIGPASCVSNGIKFLSESVYLRVIPSPDKVRHRTASTIEKIQSACVSTLIVFYSFLIGYNVYHFKIFPFIGYPAQNSAPAAPAMQASFLPTGAVPYLAVYGPGKYDRQSMNQIIFHNGKTHDAVVLLTEYITGETVRNNYIRAGDDLIMRQIPDGDYYLKVLFGNGWSDSLAPAGERPVRGGFIFNARYEIFKQEINILRMQHSRTGDTLDYRMYEITLYPVSGGHAESEPSAAADFF